MRRGLLAALTVLLAGHGLAFAQLYGSAAPPAATAAPVSRGSQPAVEAVAAPTLLPAPNSPPNNCNLDPVSREPSGDVDAQTETFGFWGSGEYLLWWIKNGRVPPLVTAGGDGKLGSPGTQVLVDNLNFADGVRQGGRFALGYHLETIPAVGVETSYFFLSDRQTAVRFSSSDGPVLAQPFLNVATGMPDANLVAKPGTAAGTVTVGAQTSLWGAEANLTAGLIGSDRFHLAALGGFRFLRLEDDLTSGEQFRVAPSVPGFGGSRVNLQDEFRTVNDFYGGQVGLETGVRFGRLTIDCRGKVALGEMHQGAEVRGATEDLRPDGSTTLFPGGLLALRSNGGLHQRDELAFIPEVGLNVGWQLTPHWKVSAGYSLLWVSTVARAGEQIDPVVNVTQFPIRSGNGPLVGSARPAFPFDGTDFWAQGLNFGLELSY
jgi:hypothetical protein